MEISQPSWITFYRNKDNWTNDLNSFSRVKTTYEGWLKLIDTKNSVVLFALDENEYITGYGVLIEVATPSEAFCVVEYCAKDEDNEVLELLIDTIEKTARGRGLKIKNVA